jgi:hypothetical protein
MAKAKQDELALVQTNEVAESFNPASLIEMALQSQASPETLKELLALQKEFEANEAKKAYIKAITAFRADPPKILKDKSVSYGNTKFKHTSLQSITKLIRKPLSDLGLSVNWTTNSDEAIKVTCTVTHSLGHSESCSLTAKADTSGGKNAIQAVGSAVKYLQRYTVLSLLGLAETDELDDDGNLGKDQKISVDQANEIKRLAEVKGTPMKKLLDHFQIDKLEDMLVTEYVQAIDIFKGMKK